MVYHVVLEGARLGPYDRRTIVGMRIKKTLTSDHLLIGADGTQLTVGDLIRHRPATLFNGDRSGSYSVVKGAFAAWLVQVSGKNAGIPRFKGEIEARVQADGVLRLAGRYRQGLGWKQGRVKVALDDMAHVRIKGTQVDVGLRGTGAGPRAQFTLELFTPQSAKDFVECLPQATPFPDSANPGKLAPAAASRQAVVTAAISVISVAMVVGLLLMVVLYRGGR